MRSGTWIDSSCAQQLRRPLGDKHTVHYGNKDTSPKKPTARHVHVDFVEGWSIRLAQTFNSISCSETSVANRISTAHEDINCLINILRDLLVLWVSEEWAKYRTKSITSGILWLKSYWEGGTRYSCTEERKLCISIECSTLWLKLDKEMQTQ